MHHASHALVLACKQCSAEVGLYTTLGALTLESRKIYPLRRRFLLYKTKKKIRKEVLRMVEYAYDNFWTTTYAKFQLLTNGIVA